MPISGGDHSCIPATRKDLERQHFTTFRVDRPIYIAIRPSLAKKSGLRRHQLYTNDFVSGTTCFRLSALSAFQAEFLAFSFPAATLKIRSSCDDLATTWQPDNPPTWQCPSKLSLGWPILNSAENRKLSRKTPDDWTRCQLRDPRLFTTKQAQHNVDPS